DPVVDHGGDRDAHRGGRLVVGDGYHGDVVQGAVDRGQRRVEGAVVGGHNRDRRVRTSVHRAGQRVVVDDVDVVPGGGAGHDGAQFGEGDPADRCLRIHPVR